MYNENELSLTEATVLALQGKLKLEETKSARKRNNRLKKTESVNVSTDNVTVSTDEAGNTTVETDKETVTVTRNALDTDLPVIDEPIENETIDVPVEGNETILPEEEVSEETFEEDEESIEDDLEESKKIESKPLNQNNIEALKEYNKKLDDLFTKLDKEEITEKEYREAVRELKINYENSLTESEKVCENCEEGKCEENKECLTEDPVKYEWVLQGNYGYGWDDLVTYDNREEAERDYKDYRENEPEYTHRIRKRVVKEETKDLTENVKIEVSDDGKEVEVTTDNEENVDVIDKTNEPKDSSEAEEIETEIEDIELEESKFEKIKVDNFNDITKLKYYLENITAKIRDDSDDDTKSCYSELINQIKSLNFNQEFKNKLIEIVNTYSKRDKSTSISDYDSILPNCISDLRGYVKNKISENISKSEKTEAKQTFNKKSFEEALTKFYNFNDERVKSFKVESIAKNKKGSIKIEGKINNKVSATMVFDKVTEGRTFITYRLNTTNGILKESKEIKTSMTLLKKENTLKCRSLISR